MRATIYPFLFHGLLFTPSVGAQGQAPPGTDIYLVPLEWDGELVHMGEVVNVTGRAGYDNQPSFTPDGRSILYTSIGRDGQADTYRYDVDADASAWLTRTSESEYSATVMPDGAGFSVVRVEADSTQRLWRFDLDGRNPELLLADVAPVGYHAWADEHTVFVYVLGTPPTLQRANVGRVSGRYRGGTGTVVASDVGRSIHRVPHRDAISFTHREGDAGWRIQELDRATGEIRSLVRAIGESQDHAWAPDGSIVMADGSTVYRWKPDFGGWREVGNLEAKGIAGITRVAVSPDGALLALVAQDGEP